MNMLAGYFTKESGQESQENTLLPKGLPVQMGPYFVTYRGDSVGTADKDKTFFIMDYEKKPSLKPSPPSVSRSTLDAYLNVKGQEGQLSPNPDSKHYLHGTSLPTSTRHPSKAP